MLRKKIKSDDSLPKIEVDGDVVELLRKIREVCCQITTNTSLYSSVDEAKRRYFTYKQQPEDDNETHLRTFKSNSDVIENYKGSMYKDKAVLDYERQQGIKKNVTHNNDELRSIVKERMMGTALRNLSDMNRYGPLMTDIRDQYDYVINLYPKTLSAGHYMLEDYIRSRQLCSKKKKLKNSDEQYRNRGDR